MSHVDSAHAPRVLPENLQHRLVTLPASPGVYLMKGADGTILYVGKAVVLKHRVRSYFQSGKALSPKIRLMVANVADLETITTRNELEALVLEANLIKHHRPHFNALMKDDKAYPFLKLTVQDDFPRLTVVRQRLDDGARYFGPYPDGTGLNHALHLIQKLFPLRKRRTPQFRDRVCLNFHLGRCLGPCQGLADQARYGAMVEEVAQFLQGRHEGIVSRLRREMGQAAEALDFERAAALRDQLASLEAFRQRQKVVGDPEDDQDAVGLAVDEHRAVFQLFQVRQGKVIGRLAYELPAEGDEAAELLETFLTQYYGQATDLPREVLLPMAVEGQAVLGEWLTQRRGVKVGVLTPQRGARRDLLDLVARNAEQERTRLALVALASSRSAAVGGPAALAEALELPEVPRRIECFDISHLGGTDIVASMVVFVDGRPAKDAYRRFKLKTVHDNDDFASMREIVARRFQRSKDGDWPWPDLVIIDGGKGQLNAALQALDVVGVARPAIVGLAKREEELFRPHADASQPWTSLRLPAGSPALHLVQQVRDEAHRFAVTFQRQLRGKRMVASVLDGVEGVGPARKKALLKRFGSVAAMRALTRDDLVAQAGLPARVVEALYEALHA
ncbi:MAG: excinuclease ABC subunit UvrC [Candidatus Sericytochromatia bacterium]|nr:excinuclease ABC subunit UvrC [Candidatus Sericytochromatia bacterium]